VDGDGEGLGLGDTDRDGDGEGLGLRDAAADFDGEGDEEPETSRPARAWPASDNGTAPTACPCPPDAVPLADGDVAGDAGRLGNGDGLGGGDGMGVGRAGRLGAGDGSPAWARGPCGEVEHCGPGGTDAEPGNSVVQSSTWRNSRTAAVSSGET